MHYYNLTIIIHNLHYKMLLKKYPIMWILFLIIHMWYDQYFDYQLLQVSLILLFLIIYTSFSFLSSFPTNILLEELLSFLGDSSFYVFFLVIYSINSLSLSVKFIITVLKNNVYIIICFSESRRTFYNYCRHTSQFS